MAETLIDDDDVPPTLDEPPRLTEVDPPPAPARPPAPPMPPGRKLAIALSILAALLLVGGVAFYLFVWRYDPVAHKHIPGNANLAARLQFSDIALFAPVREHLWPLVFEPAAHEGKPGKTRAERIHRATGVNLATDVRELYVASVEGKAFVALVGGKLERGRFVKGIAALAKEEAWPGGWHEEGELLVGPSGVTIGQAEDGTIAVGTTAAIVLASLPATEDYKRLMLPEDGAASFAVTKEAWSGAAGAAVVAHASVLRKIERAGGHFTLSKQPELAMEIVPAEGNEAAALAGEIEQLLAEMRIVTLLLPDVAGEKGALQATKVVARGDRVMVTAPWAYEALDRGCARLALLLRVGFGVGSEQASDRH